MIDTSVDTGRNTDILLVISLNIGRYRYRYTETEVLAVLVALMMTSRGVFLYEVSNVLHAGSLELHERWISERRFMSFTNKRDKSGKFNDFE